MLRSPILERYFWQGPLPTSPRCRAIPRSTSHRPQELTHRGICPRARGDLRPVAVKTSNIPQPRRRFAERWAAIAIQRWIRRLLFPPQSWDAEGSPVATQQRRRKLQRLADEALGVTGALGRQVARALRRAGLHLGWRRLCNFAVFRHPAIWRGEAAVVKAFRRCGRALASVGMGPESAKFGNILGQFGPPFGTRGRTRPNLADSRSTSAPTSTDFGRRLLELGHSRPKPGGP